MRVIFFEQTDYNGLPIELYSFHSHPIPRVGEHICIDKKFYNILSIGHDYDKLQILIHIRSAI